MAAKADFTADLFYVDNEEFEGHIQVTGTDVDILFAHLDAAREKAKNRGFKPRQNKGNTYVKVEPKKTSADAAVEVFGGAVSKECPVCGTQMDYIATKRDGGPLPFGPFFACPKCQKKINAKQRTEGVPF